MFISPSFHQSDVWKEVTLEPALTDKDEAAPVQTHAEQRLLAAEPHKHHMGLRVN